MEPGNQKKIVTIQSTSPCLSWKWTVPFSKSSFAPRSPGPSESAKLDQIWGAHSPCTLDVTLTLPDLTGSDATGKSPCWLAADSNLSQYVSLSQNRHVFWIFFAAWKLWILIRAILWDDYIGMSVCLKMGLLNPLVEHHFTIWNSLEVYGIPHCQTQAEYHSVGYIYI